MGEPGALRRLYRRFLAFREHKVSTGQEQEQEQEQEQGQEQEQEQGQGVAFHVKHSVF